MRFTSLCGAAAAAFAAVLAIGAAPAEAGEEKPCAKQYSFEEQLVLEWAALGGDPHAQISLAQCSFPQGARTLNADEAAYALKWLTIAACDSLDDEASLARNRRLRALKETGDISFRRFGGEDEDEKYTAKERMFQAYRERRENELKDRYRAFVDTVAEPERRAAFDLMVDDLARMGPLGLMRIGELARCPAFEGDAALAAAAWEAAASSFEDSPLAAVYGKSETRGWSLLKESKARQASLDPAAKRTAQFEFRRLFKTAPSELERLEADAALGDLGQLSLAYAHSGGDGTTAQSVTTALQYALESLGWMQFENGPDNDYGPATIDAARRLQEAKGVEATRWLSHEQIRDTICAAATEKGDPVSLFHVSLMYANGWGFPQDFGKAMRAVNLAEEAMTRALAKFEDLPEWKRSQYPEYDARIKLQKDSIGEVWRVLPEREKSRPSSQALCSAP